MAERGPTSATLLKRELPVTRQAIVKHLVVRVEPASSPPANARGEVRYALVPEPLDEVSAIVEIGLPWTNDARRPAGRARPGRQGILSGSLRATRVS